MRNKLAVSNGRLDDFDDDRYMKCFGWQGVWRAARRGFPIPTRSPPLLPWFAPNDDAPEESGHPVTKKTGNVGHVRLCHLRAGVQLKAALLTGGLHGDNDFSDNTTLRPGEGGFTFADNSSDYA
ncbi:hypothetical protein B0H10DRAFT_1948921 [Mycena sp. CBHHK59/15]|nr:hypothetical protein B0H10DRAFT_1948921 [Mycena sp. CBHHK59/15]